MDKYVHTTRIRGRPSVTDRRDFLITCGAVAVAGMSPVTTLATPGGAGYMAHSTGPDGFKQQIIAVSVRIFRMSFKTWSQTKGNIDRNKAQNENEKTADTAKPAADAPKKPAACVVASKT